MARERKIPGPDHPITVERFSGQVRVIWNDLVVAQTARALKLTEAGYPSVYYIPRADLRADLLQPSDSRTYCPYKGEASYLSLAAGPDRTIDAMWSYDEPYEAVAPIAGHVAFYPNRVDRIEVA